MGFFEKAGRRVEAFKQEVEDAAAAEATRECGDCGEPVFGERDDCPECGHEELVATDTDRS